MPPLSSPPDDSGNQPDAIDKKLAELEAQRAELPVATSDPLAGPNTVSLSKNRILANNLALIIAASFLVVGSAAAAVLLFTQQKPVSPGKPAVVEPLNETVVEPSSPLPSENLSVTYLSAQAASISALNVTGSASIQGSLNVFGNGTFGGTIQASNFQGSGAGLTGVNASLLGGHPSSFYTGLVNGLSGAALLSANNTFTGANTFTSSLAAGSVSANSASVGSLSALGTITATSLSLGQPLSVTNGGIGLSNVPVAAILYGQGGPTLGVAAPPSAGLCLLSGTNSDTWGSCSGAIPGVATLDNLSGLLSIANSTGVGTTVTINDASTTQKGIAQFNGADFQTSSGLVDTIQSIAVTAAPTFAGLTLGSPLTVANGGTGAASLTANGVIVAGGTSPFTSVTAGAPGDCLMSTAGAPAFAACPGSAGAGGVSTPGGTANKLAKFTGAQSIGNSSITDTGSSVSIQPTVNNASVFQIQNAAGLSVLNVDTSANISTFGNITSSVGQGLAGVLQLADGTADNFAATINTTALSASRTITIPDASGQICLTTGNCSGIGGIIGGAGTTGRIPVFTGASTIGNSGISATGTSVTFTPTADSTTAFQIQDASTADVLAVDTQNGRVAVGGAPTAGAFQVFGPTLVGYTNSLGAFAVQNSNFNNVFGVDTVNNVIAVNSPSNATAGTQLVNSISLAFQSGYWNGSSNASTAYEILNVALSTAPTYELAFKNNASQTVLSLLGTGAAKFQNGTDSTAAFQIQNAAGHNLVNVDTTGNLTTFGNISAAAGQAIAGSLLLGDGTTDNFGVTLNTVTLSANRNISLPDAPGTICTSAGNCTGLGGSIGGTGTTNDLAKFTASASIGNSSIADTGSSVTVTPVSNSTTGFQVQNASTAAVLTVDTTSTSNNIITVSNTTTNNNASLLTLQNSDGSGGIQFSTGGTSGSGNNAQDTYVGYQSGQNGALNTGAHQGQFNTALGYLAIQGGVGMTASYNTGVGYAALQGLTSGLHNAALGNGSAQSIQGANQNTAIGDASLNLDSVGNDNTALGYSALFNTGASGASANYNTAVGAGALYNNVSGVGNVAIGYAAGQGDPNATNTAGNGNIFIGYQAGTFDGAGFLTPNSLQNSTAIGYQAQVQASNSLILGGAGAQAQNVGIGTTIPESELSVSPVAYNTGTAAVTSLGTTITGTGTNWTSALVGDEFIFGTGQEGLITAVTNQTSLTVATTQAVISTPINYRIQLPGLEVSANGTAGLGMIPAVPSGAQLQVTGQSSDNSLAALQITNASGTNIGNFLNDGTVDLGGNGSTSIYGTDTLGNSTGTGFNNMMSAQKIVASANGTLTSISTYINLTVDASPNNAGQLALYADNGSGAPGNYLASSASFPEKNGTWNMASVTTLSGSAPTVTAGTTYWLIYWTKGGSGGGQDNGQLYTPGTGTWDYVTLSPGTYGTGPDNGMFASFGTPSGGGSFAFSIYATVQNNGQAEQLAGSNGAATFQNTSDSTSAFQIQNAAGTSNLFVADTAGSRIGIGTSAPTQKLEVANGNTQIDYGGLIVLGVTAPSAAPTATATGSGVLTGAYYYYVTYVTAQGGETLAGPASTVVNPSSQKVSLTGIPTGPAGVVARKIYRSVANPGFPFPGFYLTTISDNTTTAYLDISADGSLGGGTPTYNTTSFITNPQGTTGGEAFGANATLGNCADETALGANAIAGWCDSVAVGTNSAAWSSGGVALGRSATANYLSTSVGAFSSTANDGVALGQSATNNGNNASISIGQGATNTAANQLVIGSSQAGGSYIQDAYLGSGVTDTAPQSITIHATGASGSNVAGANLSLASGRGTGNASGGNINFQVAQPATSGSGLNALATVATISGVNGSTTFKNSANSTTAFQIQNASSVSVLTADTTNLRLIVGNTGGTAVGQLYVGGGLPTSPVSTFGNSVFYQGGIVTSGDYNYSIDHGCLLRIMDVSNPAAATLVSTTSVCGGGGLGNGATRMVKQGKYLYINNPSGATILVIDVSNPAAPNRVTTYNDPAGTTSVSFAVQGHDLYYAYNAGANNYLQALDISNPSSPQTIGTPLAIVANADDMAISGHFLYMVYNHTSGTVFQTVNIVNPASLAVVGSISAGSTSSGLYGPNAINSNGSRYLYVTNTGGGSPNEIGRVVDISDPTNPTVAGSFTIDVGGGGGISQVSGNRLYTFNQNGSVSVNDITTPTSASFIGSFSVPGNGQGMAIVGRYLYITGFNIAPYSWAVYDLGGTYDQQLQAGTLQTTDFEATGNGDIGGNLNIQGGLTAGLATIQSDLTVGGEFQANQDATVNGNFLQKTSANSAIAFRIQDSANVTLLTADTTHDTVGIGTPAGTVTRLTVAGPDTLSSSNALLVTDGGGTTIIKARDDNVTDIGQASTNIFGNNAAIGSYDSGSNVVIGADQFTTRNTATTVTSMTTYLGAADTSPHNHFQFAIYADSAGHPGSLIAVSGIGTVTPFSWNTAAISASLSANTPYWLAYGTDSLNSNLNEQLYTSAATPVHAFVNFSWSTVSGFPSPYGGGTTSNSTHAIYANTTGSAIPALTVGSNGSVGIGTDDITNPSANLTILTNTNTTSAFQIQNASSNVLLNADTLNNSITVTTPSDSSTALQVQNSNTNNVLAVSTVTTNIVSNSSFDSSVSGWPLKGTAATITQDTSGMYDGPGDLKAVVTSAASGVYTSTFSPSVAASTQYQLTFFAKCSSIINTFTYGHQDIVGTDINATTAAICGTGWQQYTTHYTTGASLSTPTIYMTSGTTASVTIWLDDVTLVPTTTSTATNYQPGSIYGSGVFVSPTIFQNQTDTTSAFQVQNAAGSSLLNVDSANATLAVNRGSAAQLGNNTASNWSSTTALPSNKKQGGVVTANGYIYDVGGVSTQVYYGKVNNDGTVSSWSSASALSPSTVGAATVVANGYIYAVGGYSGASYLNTTKYAKINPDGSLGSWVTSPNLLPVQESVYNQGVVANGYIYIVGGSDGPGLTTVYYAKLHSDGTIGAWSTNANSLPTTTDGGQSLAANGYLYLIGGSNNTTGYQSAQLNSDGSTGSWTRVTGVATLYTQTTAFIADGYVYDVAGFNGTNCVATINYAPLANNGVLGSWTTATSTLPDNRCYTEAAVSNGYVYELGGTTTDDATTQTTAYYISLPRTEIAGSLDLVGLNGNNLADAGSNSSGNPSGSLTAGATNIVGILQVQGMTTLNQSLTVNGIFSSNSDANFADTASSSSAFQVQNTAGVSLLQVDTATTVNLLPDPASNFETGNAWTAKGAPTSTGQDTAEAAFGTHSLKIVTGASANAGAQYAYAFSPTTQYTLSLYARINAGSMTTLNIGRQDQSGTDIDCLTGQTVTGNGTSSGWTRYTCTFTTGGTISGSNIYVKDTGTSHTFWVDGVQLETAAAASAFNPGGELQLNGPVSSALQIRNTQNSTTALRVENVNNTQVFNVDTTNNRVTIGAGSSQAKLYVTTGSGNTGGNDALRVSQGGGANLLDLADNGTDAILFSQEGSISMGVNTAQNAAGTVTTTGVGATVTGTGTAFREVFKPGDTLTFADSSTCAVATITDETHLTCTTTPAVESGTFTFSGAGNTDKIQLNASGQLALGISKGSTTLNDQLTVDNTSASGVTTDNSNGVHVNYLGGSAAVEGSGIRVDYTPGGTSGGTWDGLHIVAAGVPASGVSSYGIKLEGNATGHLGLETAINITTGWDVGMMIQSGGIQMSGTNDPSAPSTAATASPNSGAVKLYAQSTAGRMFYKVIGPTGNSYSLQPSLFDHYVCFASNPYGGTSSSFAGFGCNGKFLNGIGNATETISEATGPMSKYTNAASGTGAAAAAGFETGTTGNGIFYRGSTSGGSNGFFFMGRVDWTSANYTNGRTFVGLYQGAGDTAGVASVYDQDDPTSSRAGFSYSGTRGGNIRFATGDGTNTNNADTGVALTVNHVYDMYIYCPSQCTTIYWRIDDRTSSTTTTGSTILNLPAATQAMNAGLGVTTTSSGTQYKIDYEHVYVEVDR